MATKLILGVFFGLAFVAWAYLAPHRRRACHEWLPAAGYLCLAYFLVRAAGLLVVHEVLGLRIPADIPGYVEHGTAILGGGMPLRDFSTPYAFGFEYLLALICGVWTHPLAVMLGFQAVECAGLWLILRSIQDFTAPQWNWKDVFILYALNPLVVTSLWLGGQDESLLVFVLGASLAVSLAVRMTFLRWLVPAGLFFMSKLFALWIIAPLAIKLPRSQQFAMVIALALGLGAIALAVGGAPIGFEFSRASGAPDELAKFVTPGNIWFWADLALGRVHPLLILGTFAGCMLLVGLLLLRSAPALEPIIAILAGAPVLALTYQCFYKMSFPAYLAPTLACIVCLVCAGRLHRHALVAVALWSSLASFAMSYWYEIKGDPVSYSSHLWGLGLLDLVIISSQLATLLVLLRWVSDLPRGRALTRSTA